jgi:hypothetical protein
LLTSRNKTPLLSGINHTCHALRLVRVHRANRMVGTGHLGQGGRKQDVSEKSEERNRFNIILSSTPKFCKWSLPFRYPVCMHFSSPPPHAYYIPRPSHLPLFNHSCRVRIVNFLTVEVSVSVCPLVPHRLKYFPQLPSLKHTKSVCFS